MNIVVIGGTGFVGQYLVQKLSDAGHIVTVACRKKSVDLFINVWNLPRVSAIENVDVSDVSRLCFVVSGADVVYNVAGFVSFRHRDQQRLIQINHQGALHVLHAVDKARVKKFIHVSSTAALGSGHDIQEDKPDFDWSKHKHCVYSYSKFLPNQEILKAPFQTIVVYPPLVLGPGDTKNTKTLITAIKSRAIPFNPDGSNSIIDVRDLARALVLLGTTDAASGKYIVSGGHYSFEKLNEVIATLINVKPPHVTVPRFLRHPFLLLAWLMERISPQSIVTHESVFWSFTHRTHKTEKIAALGFQPEYALTKTIEDAWKWMQTHNL